MRNLYLVAVLATVWLGACTTDSGVVIKCTINGETKEFTLSPGREDCDKIRANPTAAVTTTVPTATTGANGKTAETPIFATPVVAQPTSGLVEPTNKAQRQDELVAKASSGDRDPFVVIPGSVPLPPEAPRPPVIRRPTFIPQVTIKPVEPPSTVEASAVQVSGILDIGGSKYAIVNAPGEPTSRPISLGQTFAGGKVLFKRIQDAGGNTFVILEQNGVEVTRPVGKQAIAEAPKPL
jgi:hypothetical protein